jgi:hypothetical protein
MRVAFAFNIGPQVSLLRDEWIIIFSMFTKSEYILKMTTINLHAINALRTVINVWYLNPLDRSFRNFGAFQWHCFLYFLKWFMGATERQQSSNSHKEKSRGVRSNDLWGHSTECDVLRNARTVSIKCGGALFCACAVTERHAEFWFLPVKSSASDRCVVPGTTSISVSILSWSRRMKKLYNSL